MANNVNNVTTGKPKVGGAVYFGVPGTDLSIPTDASTALDTDFVCLGYVSEDGLTNSNSPEVEEIRAWGGDVVLTPLTGKPDTFQFTLIEAENLDVLKAVYGTANVSGSLSTGVTVKANASLPTDYAWVFEVVLAGNVAKRIVIPQASITEIGDITYTDGGAVGYQLTINAKPNASGDTHYEYLKTISA